MADEMKNVQKKQTEKAPTKEAKTTKSPEKKTETKPKKKEGLMYQGHPLRRSENLIYYGSMADKYIVMMQVLDSEPLNDISIAKRVSVQLQLTDTGTKPEAVLCAAQRNIVWPRRWSSPASGLTEH